MNSEVWVGSIAIICEVMAVLFLLANHDATDQELKEFTTIIVVGMLIFWALFGALAWASPL